MHNDNEIYGYIYLVENNITGQKYVGKHKYPRIELDPKYKGSGLALNKDISKYGIANFSYNLIDIAYNSNSLNELEKYWISYYNTYNNPIHYNKTEGGDGGKLVDIPWNKGKKNCYRKEQIKKMNDGIKRFVSSLTPEEKKFLYGNHNVGRVKEKYDGKNCKYTPELILNIINDYKEPKCTTKILCKKYNISFGALEKILHGDTWHHTTGIDKNTWKEYWKKNKKILISKYQQEKIQKYLDEGYGQQKIANLLNLTRTIIISFIENNKEGRYYVFE